MSNPINEVGTVALARYRQDKLAIAEFNWYLFHIMKESSGRQLKAMEAAAAGDPTELLQLRNEGLYRPNGRFNSQYFCEMTLCRTVDSYLTYLADLLTNVFSARPEMLKSSKETVTLQFVLDHHAADDLLSAIVERKVNQLSYQGMRDLAEFFQKKLGIPLFKSASDLEKAILCVDIRNLIVHNRGIVNRTFRSRQPNFTATLGCRIEFPDQAYVQEMFGLFSDAAEELDRRVIEHFRLTLDRQAIESLKQILMKSQELPPSTE
jgi:hypothetical protein